MEYLIRGCGGGLKLRKRVNVPEEDKVIDDTLEVKASNTAEIARVSEFFV